VEENKASNQVEEKPEVSEGASVGGGPEERILRLPFLQMYRTARQTQQVALWISILINSSQQIVS